MAELIYIRTRWSTKRKVPSHNCLIESIYLFELPTNNFLLLITEDDVLDETCLCGLYAGCNSKSLARYDLFNSLI